MTLPVPDYKDLDLSGEAAQAAARMEARALEPASRELFQYLVAPLLGERVKYVLEFGCGTAALSRKIARAAPWAAVYASDKSEGMLEAARRHVAAEQQANVQLFRWDVLDEGDFPFPTRQFDLVISSVVAPYLNDEQTVAAIQRLAAYLAPGGVLAFVEQDWLTESANFPEFALVREAFSKRRSRLRRALGLGLRPVLREAGLRVLPRRSFLWTDDHYGAYSRIVLERFAEALFKLGHIQESECDAWKQTWDKLAEAGDFYYAIVYHLVAGQKPDPEGEPKPRQGNLA